MNFLIKFVKNINSQLNYAKSTLILLNVSGNNLKPWKISKEESRKLLIKVRTFRRRKKYFIESKFSWKNP